MTGSDTSSKRNSKVPFLQNGKLRSSDLTPSTTLQDRDNEFQVGARPRGRMFLGMSKSTARSRLIDIQPSDCRIGAAHIRQ